MAAEEERRVELVRVPREERYYDRESVLGRDVSSVFPTRAKEEEGAGGGGTLDADAVREMIGGRKFISESELETIRKTRGATADDGAVSVDKPLSEILREAKDAKQAEFEAKWKQMKTGKNRPVDPEDLDFFDTIAQQEAERDKAWQEQESAELEAYRAALRERGPPEEELNPAPKPPTAAPGRVEGPKPANRPALPQVTVKVKPKAAAPGSSSSGGGKAAAAEPAAKRQKPDGAAPLLPPPAKPAGAGAAAAAAAGAPAAGLPGVQAADNVGDDAPQGLTGLLGAYSSSSDDEQS